MNHVKWGIAMTDTYCAWNNANNNNGNNNVVGVSALPIVLGRPNAGMHLGPKHSIAILRGSAQKQASKKLGAHQ